MRRLKAVIGLLTAALCFVILVSGSAPAASAGGRPLRYLGGDFGTLDPAFIGDASDVQLHLQLYAGLTRLDEVGNVYASLAADWTVSDDGETYTFRLRDGLAFSDGTALTADDVRRSWMRILDPATGSYAPDILTVIRGAAAWRSGAASADEVGLKVPDPLTLVVELEHPASHFPALVATPTAFVVPPGADASSSWQSISDFIGSGPYVADRLDGSSLVLAANPEYVAGPPPIDEIEWMAEVDPSAPEAFAADAVDLTTVFSGDATWIAYDEDLGPHLHQAAALGVQYFGFDTTRPPFDDVRVRRAFLLALDRPSLVAQAEGSAATVATSVVPSALWPDGIPTDEPGDLDAARALLAEAGYATGAELGVITVNGNGLNVAPAVAVWREELGVNLAVETMDWVDYLTVLPDRPTPIFTVNWITDYPSPYALYGLLLLPDAASNHGGWDSADFVARMEEAARETDPAAQREAYLAVEAVVDAEAPIIPWSWDATQWLVREDLRGTGNLTVGLLDFGRLSWAD